MRFDAPITNERINADSMPECSATATPNNATNTVPSGVNPVKLVTKLATIQRNPSAENKDTTSIMPSASRPLAPTGLGSSTLIPMNSAKPLNNTINTQNKANKVIGCGNKLPNHSTVDKKRANQP